MKRWLFLWLWGLSLTGLALPPTKSIICISLIRQIQHNLLLASNSDTRQVLREFQKLGLDTLGQRDASAAVPTFFHTSTERLSAASVRHMSDRIQGLIEFNRQVDAQGDQRFVDTLSLVGDPARNFLYAWSNEVAQLDEFMNDQGIQDFRVLTVLNAFLLANVNWPLMAEGFGSTDPVIMARAAGRMGNIV